ncbi:MAG: HTTM domain-containing protein, partial [Planctomyces sp.]
LLLVNAGLLLPLMNDYYSECGIWPERLSRSTCRGSRLSLQALLPEGWLPFRVLLLLHVGAVFCFVIGWQFRGASIVVFLTLASIHHRNPWILSSGDSLLRLLTFFCCFADAAGGLSVDHWLQGFPVGHFNRMDPWPLRLMQLQVSIVYLRTVAWKLSGPRWRDGSAAWYPLWVDAYVRWRPPQWLLRPALIRAATWGTLAEEAVLGAGLWVQELRMPLLISGILLHLVFELVLNLQLFSWIMICSLLLFLEPDVLQSWLQGVLF